MNFIWLTFVFEMIVLALLSDYISPGFVVVLVLMHSLLTMVYLISRKDYRFILLGAYFARLVFMFWDLYANHIFNLPNSGADTESFYQQAIFFSENSNYLFSHNGEVYSKIIGTLFSFVGPYRIVGQYVNVLVGLSVVLMLYKIFKMLEINEKTSKRVLLIAAIFPNSLIMSAIFLREIFPTFFVTISAYYLVRWIKNPKFVYMILSFALLGIASIFHSGLMGLSLGYIFAYLFYKKETNRLAFSYKTIASFIVITSVFSLIFTVFEDIVFQKFQSITSIEDIYQKASKPGEGGSAYLQNISISNPIQLLFFGPIRSLYFISSPLPMNWRGFMDVFTFFTDAILYTGVVSYFLKNRNKLGYSQPLAISFFMVILGAILVFGIGVSNAGTAVRHRQKLISIFLILLAIIIDSKGKSIAKSNNKVRSDNSEH